MIAQIYGFCAPQHVGCPNIMVSLLHRTPSVGSVIKKLLVINPELGTPELIAIIQRSTEKQGGAGNEFSTAEIINEDKALSFARATLGKTQTANF